MLEELVEKNRSYRRFYEDKKISMTTLKKLVDIARKTASGGNRQPVRYKLVCDRKEREQVFACLAWAGYYKDWPGPEEGERPTAYILLATPEEAQAGYDEGIVAQTILLAAVEQGLGGCILANINRRKLMDVASIPVGYKVDLCIALGSPKEKAVLETISENGDYHYFRDEKSVQHVPKIKLQDLLL